MGILNFFFSLRNRAQNHKPAVLITRGIGILFCFTLASCGTPAHRSGPTPQKPEVKTSPAAAPAPMATPAPSPTPLPTRADSPAPMAPSAPSAAKAPRLGLILGGGGLRSFAHLGVLQALEKNNISVHAIAGLEWGSLVGALYSSQGRLHDVEWKLFKLKEENLPKSKLFKSATPLGDPALILPYLNETLATHKIENGSIGFTCPFQQLSQAQAAWIRKGSLRDAVLFCLPYPPLFGAYKGYVAAPTEVAAAARMLREMGSTVIVYVHLLNPGPIAQETQFESGVAGQLLWKLNKKEIQDQRKGIDLVIDVSLPRADLMDLDQVRNFVSAGQSASSQVVRTLTQQFGF